MAASRTFGAALALFLAACDGGASSEEGRPLGGGAILYRPGSDARIHAKVHSPIFTYPYEITDDATGYRLTQVQLRQLKGHGGYFTEWKVDRSKDHKPAIHFVTRETKERLPGAWPWDEVVEIAYAKEDGFQLLKEALYPADLSFSRIAGMLDRYGLTEGRHSRVYLDNRLPNRRRYEQWARERLRLPFLLPNFDTYDPLGVAGARLYLPAPGSATYDESTKTAVAADGSRLRWDDGSWSIYLDRDGRRFRIDATWFDASGGKQVHVTMLGLRAFRKGYGETRAVELIVDGTPPKAGIADAGTPDGKSLADLINVTVPIAGEHAGHMMVIDQRTHPGEWR